MRIQTVVARSFGPFHGESLELAPGMTLVSGPNGSGKSSWHAALRLALTGLRRGRGRATAADAALAEQHRPWDNGEEWSVESRIQLDDGRLIEVQQDLAGKVACRAVEVGLGRDVSNEILDGTPDGARWLGMDRETFAVTVSVAQASILAVADAADLLQDQMQRAASSRGSDATASEAIERLVEFRRESVGSESVAAKGPWRMAVNRLALAGHALEEARQLHGEYLEQAARAEAAERELGAARGRLATALAADAVDRSRVAARRASRAAELAARHPEPPPNLSLDADTATSVAAAVSAWRHRLIPAPLSGPSSADIAGELATLPAHVPVGDLEVHPTVSGALAQLDGAEAAEAAQAAQRAASIPSESGRAANRTDAARHGGPSGALILAAVLAAVSGLAFVVGAPALAAGLVLGAIALAGWALAARAGIMGLEPEARAGLPEERFQARTARGDEPSAGFAQARAALTDVLRARGVVVEGDPRGSAAAYADACRVRAGVAARAQQHAVLSRALEARQHAEAQLEAADRAAAEAELALRAAADQVALASPASEADVLAAALERWLADRSRALAANQAAIEEWRELNDLLAGRTVGDLEAEARTLAARSTELGRRADAQERSRLEGNPQLEAEIDRRRASESAAEKELHRLRGSLETLAATLPSVAEAEEAVETARSEVAEIEQLATTIDETLRLLREAQESVHRDLAPMLAGGVQRWLPLVSDGAYAEVSVDPADLAVRVKEADTGRWRLARLLSEGTREQIYLLLRVAMAQHLVTTGETAPLLLDEVTAQADAHRRVALLDMLHEISRERQVVLFSHDDAVLGWAEARLRGARDRIVRLPHRGASARRRAIEVEPLPAALSA